MMRNAQFPEPPILAMTICLAVAILCFTLAGY